MLHMSSAQRSVTGVLKPAVKKNVFISKQNGCGQSMEGIYSLAILYECVHRYRYIYRESYIDIDIYVLEFISF